MIVNEISPLLTDQFVELFSRVSFSNNYERIMNDQVATTLRVLGPAQATRRVAHTSRTLIITSESDAFALFPLPLPLTHI